MRSIVNVFPRSVADGGGEVVYELPGWAIPVLLLNFIVFIPLYFYISYTLCTVFPIFAIIEDENPPAYEPVALTEDEDARDTQRKPFTGSSETVTSSIRSVNRLLYANGGWRSYFRGIGFFIVEGLITGLLSGLFTLVFGGFFTPIATLLATLVTVQISTAWVHIIMAPSAKSNWSRLPSFKRAFDATWQPTCLYWLAFEVMRWSPRLLQIVFNVPFPDVESIGDGPHSINWAEFSYFRFAALAITYLLIVFWVHIPAFVVLVRVQASLLPGDDNPMMPFDRSFQGRVQPAVVDGKGYATIYDAWTTYSRAAWRRLLVLSAKNFGIALAFVFTVGSIVGAELAVISHKSVRN